jgi:hypothetical protein
MWLEYLVQLKVRVRDFPACNKLPQSAAIPRIPVLTLHKKFRRNLFHSSRDKIWNVIRKQIVKIVLLYVDFNFLLFENTLEQFVPDSLIASILVLLLRYCTQAYTKLSEWACLAYIGKKKTSWSESASELYRPSDSRLLAKWLPTLADRGCNVVSVTDPYGRILGFLDKSRYFSI